MFDVAEPFCPHQIKNTVANDDFERRKRQMALDVCYSKHCFLSCSFWYLFHIVNGYAVDVSTAQV